MKLAVSGPTAAKAGDTWLYSGVQARIIKLLCERTYRSLSYLGFEMAGIVARMWKGLVESPIVMEPTRELSIPRAGAPAAAPLATLVSDRTRQTFVSCTGPLGAVKSWSVSRNSCD